MDELTPDELEVVRDAVRERHEHLQSFTWTQRVYAFLAERNRLMESALVKIEARLRDHTVDQ